ncbi:MAG: ABC transporter permease [Acidimicrobiia bacterium]|nr:ABC transporter permease [Acidimicrobiia bacterium]
MTALPAPVLRRGAAYWMAGYRGMLRFDLASAREWLVPFVLVQVLMGAGMALVYGFYLGNMPAAAATFVATGAPTLAVIPLGMALAPSLIAGRKIEGTYDFMWSLPVPRLTAALSSYTVFTALAAPGFAAALGIAAWRYDLDLHVSAWVVPAVLLSSLMAASVGFAVGHAVTEPALVNVITNLVIFVVLMFSPIAFPIENFPGWLAAAHRVLPFWHMANVVRASLTEGLVTGAWASYLVLAGWTLGAWLLAAWAVGRRR